MGFSTKRGRPKRERTSIDTGTPELKAKHAQGLTSEVPDLLHRQGIINDQQHKAGMHLRWLYTLRFGIPTVRSLDLSRVASSGPDARDPKWAAEREAEFRESLRLLDSVNARACVINVAIFNRLPRTMLSEKHGRLCISRAHPDFAKLLKGLDILSEM